MGCRITESVCPEQRIGFSPYVRAPGPGPVNSALRFPVMWTHTPCSLFLGSHDGAWREPATAARTVVHPDTWLCSFEHVCRQMEHWKRDTGSKTYAELLRWGSHCGQTPIPRRAMQRTSDDLPAHRPIPSQVLESCNIPMRSDETTDIAGRSELPRLGQDGAVAGVLRASKPLEWPIRSHYRGNWKLILRKPDDRAPVLRFALHVLGLRAHSG
jgi:hypothetical protein